MQFEQYVYPPYGTPLVEAYDGAFESVFIVFHPFVRVPDALAWKATKSYPTDEQILSAGAKHSWEQIVAQLGLRSCSHLNQALLTSTGALVDYLSDIPARDALQNFLQTESVWMPSEGRFEPLLQADFLRAFETAGFDELVFVPEFPQNDPMQRIGIRELRDKLPFAMAGSLVAPDASFLFTVDWDSFFTLFYGPRAFVSTMVREWSLEGFWATPTTDHAWFNYNMGCATVTVSPEEVPISETMFSVSN